jgi:CDP-glycerol glycerophosphotransferase (TagB/SpsB family)
VSLKRIIWAPHHTIDFREGLGYSNFLRYHQIMLDIAENYKDKIQIAFKPHPLLKVKLSKHEEWGKQRTHNYYLTWENLDNGQLETDDYVDLFNTSDAMIFDSASFLAEYLYCGKPSLFTFSDSNTKDRFNEFGKLALEQHYHAYNETQIMDFIENVVCAGKDIKKENRKVFYHKHLIPPNDKTASENIYNEIINAIWN